jgi:hypothetical protein
VVYLRVGRVEHLGLRRPLIGLQPFFVAQRLPQLPGRDSEIFRFSRS